MRQFRFVLAISGLFVGAVLLSAQNGSAPTLVRGFSAGRSQAELERERAFIRMPSAKAAEADFDVMTKEPHHTGSPYQIALADYVAGEFGRFGFDVTPHEYSVLVPWPGDRRVDIVAPDAVK